MAKNRLLRGPRVAPLMWGLVMGTIIMIAVAAQAHEGHEHMAEPSGLSEFIDPSLLGFSGLHEIANIHPAFVHLPLALFPSALLLYGLGVVLKRPSWIVAGRACLYLAAVGTAATIFTGWQAQDSFPHNERIHHMMMTHLHIGLAVGVLAVTLVLWSFWQRGQQHKGVYGFLAVLAFTTYLALQNGDLGSRMVYVEGAAVKPALSTMTSGHERGESPSHRRNPDQSPPHTH